MLGCRCWSDRLGWNGRTTALHALDVANHVIQCWMVSENKVLVDGETNLSGCLP